LISDPIQTLDRIASFPNPDLDDVPRRLGTHAATPAHRRPPPGGGGRAGVRGDGEPETLGWLKAGRCALLREGS
jgi:hypothetical protein